MESASRMALGAVMDGASLHLDPVFLAYCETMQYGRVDHYAAPKEARDVAKSAVRNTVDSLRRGINSKADDVESFAMQRDKEWLGAWESNVGAILCTGEYPVAESYFAKHGIRS